jgi:serine/threonine protein kinase
MTRERGDGLPVEPAAPAGENGSESELAGERTAATISYADPAPAGPRYELPTVAAEAYQLIAEVARGGQGRIIRALDTRLGREVALKQLHDSGANRARFLREALVTARLQHPAIIPVHEVGQLPSGEPFIAMKLVRGQSLREAIAARPTLNERLELMPNVLAVADAIAYAHSLRVIHRDLKPANVLVGAFGETVVIDWGLAKQLDDPPDEGPAGEKLVGPGDATMTGQVLGTPVYMSPEQALGLPADERSDVYALGAILYHLIAGQQPFLARDARDALQSLLHGAPTRLATRGTGAPPELIAIVERAMARQPDARYSDARQFADELRRFQLGQLTTTRGETDDPALQAEFDAEQRRQTLTSLRVTTLLALTLIAIFAFLDLVPFRGLINDQLIARVLLLVLLGGVLQATYTDAGRRWSYELAMLTVALLGWFFIALQWMRAGKAEQLFMPSMLLVFLVCLASFQLPRGKVLAVLCFLTVSQLIVAVAFEKPPAFDLFCQTSFFVAAIIVVAVGAGISHRRRRDEFFGRRQLERANERLAKVEKRSP